MKNISKKFLLLLTVIFCFNCSSSDDTEPMPDGGPDTNPNPNKITTYDADVKAIIDGQCLRCHTIPLAEGATFPMRNFQETIDGVNRDLVLFVQSSGANVMPPSGRLPQATIDIILDWEADGFLEN
ncbi:MULTISPECIES: hypothetical protein [Aquimarina]|uniref:Cytochrome c n=1 Tax=Aquimarina algiphila TaxID=2047982 RepID=A0A554VQP9_9FLAO|nr:MULTISPECIES: hypothetical protein [Aquimarina]TSE10867.1 hypothetical protein FOF46_03210 [Aquimarina algiphila]